MSDETHPWKAGPNRNNGSWRLEMGGLVTYKDWPLNGTFLGFSGQKEGGVPESEEA